MYYIYYKDCYFLRGLTYVVHYTKIIFNTYYTTKVHRFALGEF